MYMLKLVYDDNLKKSTRVLKYGYLFRSIMGSFSTVQVFYSPYFLNAKTERINITARIFGSKNQ